MLLYSSNQVRVYKVICSLYVEAAIAVNDGDALLSTPDCYLLGSRCARASSHRKRDVPFTGDTSSHSKELQALCLARDGRALYLDDIAAIESADFCGVWVIVRQYSVQWSEESAARRTCMVSDG